ncbi:MAG: calcium/sodium antiporter [archaeon]|nr:calcium/sodium antiporter [archaeon]
MALESVLLFAIGIILLIKSADFFVDAAAKVAKLLGISDLVIGLTIVSIGTSLPEIVSSLFAAFEGAPDLAIGTVVGSNIANIALILGFTALFVGTIKVDKKALEKDLFIMLMVSAMFFYFAIDGVISFFEGTIFVVLFAFYMLFLFGILKKFESIFSINRFLKQFFGTEPFQVFNLKTYFRIMQVGIDPATYKKILGFDGNKFEEKIGKRIDSSEKTEAKNIFSNEFLSVFINQAVILVISGAGVIYGAQILIDGAIGIANFFNISSSLIGLFLVAIGTSLPELGVTISSARKGYFDILIGNIIGSNISNILLVIGSTSVLSTLVFSFSEILVPMFFMLFISAVLWFAISRNHDINKAEASLFLVIYAAFVFITYLSVF